MIFDNFLKLTFCIISEPFSLGENLNLIIQKNDTYSPICVLSYVSYYTPQQSYFLGITQENQSINQNYEMALISIAGIGKSEQEQ